MKRILIAICLVVFLLVGSASAQEPSYGPFTLLSAVTATGAGTALDLGFLTAKSTCHVTWSGTAPTNTVVALEGSINNSTYAALATVTVTATGTMWHMVNKPVRYLRGNYVSKSGGDGTTAVTMICTAGGN